MSKFSSLNCRTFKTYLEMMDALIQCGYDNEFDNSLVIREILSKIDDVWAIAGNHTGVYFTTLYELDRNHGTILKVTIRSSVSERAQQTIILFEDESGTLKVSTNVIKQKVKEARETTEQYHYKDLTRSELKSTLARLSIELSVRAMTMVRFAFDNYAPEGYEDQCRVDLKIDEGLLTLAMTVSSNPVLKLQIPYRRHSCLMDLPVTSAMSCC